LLGASPPSSTFSALSALDEAIAEPEYCNFTRQAVTFFKSYNADRVATISSRAIVKQLQTRIASQKIFNQRSAKLPISPQNSTGESSLKHKNSAIPVGVFTGSSHFSLNFKSEAS